MTAEPYIDIEALATLMGVSPSTIYRWRTAGMPSETWGMTRTRRYLLTDCVAWARDRSTVGSDPLTAARAKAHHG